MRALLIEDDGELAAGIALGFKQHGFVIDTLYAAESAQEFLAATTYDLAILDIGLPGMDGLELLRRMRHGGSTTPTIMLTARDAVEDRVRGLNLGADDYLVKPFSLSELLARCHAVIRRSKSAANAVMQVGPLTIDTAERRALLDGMPLELTVREWTVLLHLALVSPQVIARRKLLESLQRWDHAITDNALDIYVSRLRRKLGHAAAMLCTVRGIGYRFDARLSASSPP